MSMNCPQVRGVLDAHATGSLHGPQREGVAAHLRQCSACRDEFKAIGDLVRTLRAAPIPPPPADLAARLVRNARARDEMTRRRPAVFGAAIAATLLIGVGIGVALSLFVKAPGANTVVAQAAPAAPVAAPAPAMARPAPAARAVAQARPKPATPMPASTEITIAVGAEQTVALEFNAARPLKHAAFVITIPAGVEIAGHESKQRIAWVGELKQGRNRLNLRLRAKPGSNGVLVASIQHDGRDNAIALKVRAVDNGPASQG